MGSRHRVKPRQPKMLESEVTQGVLDAARCVGVNLERQNVGGRHTPGGGYVPFGKPGDPDWRGVIPTGPRRGVAVWLEIKREGFDPRKLRGKGREHFDRQVARMQELNARGEFALWVNDAADALFVLRWLASNDPVEMGFNGDGFPWIK